MTCIFCKIATKEIPKEFIYEDADVVAFLSIGPINPGHALVIAKAHSTDFTDFDPVDMTAVMQAAQRIARAFKDLGMPGMNIIYNVDKAGGQTVFHTHVHIIPRHPGDGFLPWPENSYAPGEEAEWVAKIKTALR
jgi:histidine triad (HIT) family protein